MKVFIVMELGENVPMDYTLFVEGDRAEADAFFDRLCEETLTDENESEAEFEAEGTLRVAGDHEYAIYMVERELVI